LLVLHSPLDRVVAIEHARRLFEAAKHPKSFISLDDADHLLTDPADAEYVATVLDAWVSRYLERAGRESRQGPLLQPGEVRVAENGLGHLAQDVHAGNHRIPADEPREQGGGDTGPAPYDYLLAALGACTSMTLRMYADYKGLALRHVSVQLRHERVHAEDCENCEHKSGRLALIHRRISLQGDLSEAQRQRMLEIADRCPVHRTLKGQLEIHTRESD
jgi:putative redox protein